VSATSGAFNVLVTQDTQANLTAEEQAILKFLAQLDGAPMNLNEVHQILQCSQLRAQSVLSRLSEKDLIAKDYNGYGADIWLLTEEGREYAIARNWA
jgi:DNA-binding MarR family transcriptional regulator